MFCPKCKLEYRAGFTRCNDCDVDLVAALPGEMAAPETVGTRDLRSPSILRQGVSANDAPVVRDALNAAGIRFNTRRSSAEIVAESSLSYEFWVDSVDREKAQSVLARALHDDDSGEPVESPQLLWSGTDRGMFDSLCEALDDEGIAYLRFEPFESRLSKDVSRRNPLEVSVGEAELIAARKILASLSENSPRSNATSVAPDALDATATIGAVESPEDPDSNAETDEVLAVEDDLDEDELTAEAWSGADAGQANILKLCLREVGIACRIAKVSSGVRVLVAENAAARSREIVREVLEAKPPE